MKFKRLEIKNIASIKHVVIDFDKEPLSSAQLFLINGPTGSGKSVIFDSVCLALFRTAPRLENLGNRKIEEVDSDNGEVKLSSPISFVRRGESEAFVALEFEGNNGHQYLARWYTQSYERGAKKGQIKNESHSLTDLTTSEEHRSATEIRDIVKSNDVVGLDYGRFTRTTMLAQGAFTRFISADDKEKTDILSKIVGLEQFSRIGKKIAQLYTEKKHEFEIKQAALSSIVFMPDDVLEQTTSELRQTESSLKKVKAEYDHLKRFVDYKDKMTRLNQEVLRHEEAWKSVLERLTSDSFSEIVTYNHYLERIEPLAEIERQLASSLSVKTQLDLTERELSQKRESVRLGVINLSSTIQDEQSRLNMFDDELKTFEKYEKFIENGPILKEKIKQHGLTEKKIGVLSSTIISLEKKATALAAPLKELTDKIGSLEGELKQAVDEETHLKSLFDKEGFDRMTATGNTLSERLRKLNQALEPAQKLNYVREQLDEADKEKNNIEENLANIEKELEKAVEKKNQTSKQLAEFKERYDRARRSISDSATELRHGLKIGDDCPVCGSKIKRDLLDEAFENAFKPFDEQLADYNEKDGEALAILNELILKRDTSRSLLKSSIKKIETLKKDIEKYKSSLQTLLDESGYEVDSENLGTLLADEVKSLNILINENNQKIKEIVALQNQIVSASQKVSKLTTDLARIRQNLSDKTVEKEKLESEIAGKKVESDELNNDIAAIKSEIKSVVPDDLIESPFNKLVEEIDRLTTKKQTLENHIVELKQSIKDKTGLKEDIENILKTVTFEKTDFQGVVPASVNKLRSEINRLVSDAAVLKSRRKDNIEETNRLKTLEMEFFNLNGDLSREFCQNCLQSLGELDRTREFIAGVLNQARDCYQSYAAARNMLLSQKDIEIESSCKIEFEEAVNRVALLQSETEKLSSTVGALRQMIETDNENKRRHASQRAEIEELEKEVSLWSEVNSDFGGQNGERFTRVAAAFVLNNLVERANFYLPMFTPRYTVATNTGSLEIRIYDNQDGFTRAFNTLSGGESFMVSLSLALALSSIQDAKTIPDTIFIDEGFGTLSADCLDRVMTTLEQLQFIEGRRVGIISHIESICERIPVKISVLPKGNHSEVVITAN